MTNPVILTSLHGQELGLTADGYLAGYGLKGIQIGRVDGVNGTNHPLRPEAAYVENFDDFMGVAVHPALWSVYKGSDGAAVLPTIVASAVDGVVRLTTGAGAGATMAVNGSQINGGMNFQAQAAGGVAGVSNGLAAEFRIGNVGALTNLALFFGFANQAAALQMPATQSAGTVTYNQNDLVGFLFDSAMTSPQLVGVGRKATVAATPQNFGTTVNPPTTAGKFSIYRLELDGSGNASFFVNGSQVGTVMASAVTPTTLLTPVVAAFVHAASSTTVDVDYIDTWQER